MLFPMVEGPGRRITWSFSTFVYVSFFYFACEAVEDERTSKGTHPTVMLMGVDGEVKARLRLKLQDSLTCVIVTDDDICRV